MARAAVDVQIGGRGGGIEWQGQPKSEDVPKRLERSDVKAGDVCRVDELLRGIVVVAGCSDVRCTQDGSRRVIGSRGEGIGLITSLRGFKDYVLVSARGNKGS